jgi:broad specificity phosphatase PhoE
MDRRRRRRLRLIPVVGYTIAALGRAYLHGERPSTTVIFVRHADTETAMSADPNDDPPLSARGRARAELLADALENIDVVSGVNAIYASDKRRTQETAAPLAKRLNIPVEIADPLDTKGFMARVMRDHKGEIVLIVSHSNTIAPLIDELHGSKNLKPFASNEYDRMYVVTTPRPRGKVKTLELRYAGPPMEAPVVAEPPAAEAPVESPSSANGGK